MSTSTPLRYIPLTEQRVLGKKRKTTVERYNELLKSRPEMTFDEILEDLEIAQDEKTRIGTPRYTTVDDFKKYVVKKKLFNITNAKNLQWMPQLPHSTVAEYFKNNPDKYKRHLEKVRGNRNTQEYKAKSSVDGSNTRRRTATIVRYITMMETKPMTFEEILEDLKNVQEALTKFKTKKYATVEDFDKYITEKIRIRTKYAKEDTTPVGKFVDLILNVNKM